MLFKELGLSETILRTLETLEYSIPTSIQELAIPSILKHKDVLGCAQTGTGKTAAFVLPIIESLIKDKRNVGNIRVLVLSPTRELAIQTRDNCRTYSMNTNLKSAVVLGGVNQRSQEEVLRKGVDILVATPGRLLDLVNQRVVKLNNIEVLVLDEADTMLDMGFINDIRKIIENEVIKRSNKFEKEHSYNFWNIHIKFVVENAIILAKKYNADVEIVTLAALLHDIASITKEEYQENHEIIGADIAEKLLRDNNYPKDKIELVKKCILNHRGSKIVKKGTIEEICVADADALAHFNNVPTLFSLAYNKNKLSIEDGKIFVKEKLARSYNKLSNQTKKDYEEKYKSILDIIS